jgi:hypothetical protein
MMARRGVVVGRTWARADCNRRRKKPAGQSLRVHARSETQVRSRLCAIIPNRFDRAAFLGFLAAPFLFRAGRLLVNKGIPTVIVTLEVIRGRLSAKVAIYALVIDVVLARHVFRITICFVSHKKIRLLCGDQCCRPRLRWQD